MPCVRTPTVSPASSVLDDDAHIWAHASPSRSSRATFSVASVVTSRPNDVVLHAKTLVDLEGRFAFTSHRNLALGAENLFDQYPDPNPPVANPTGTTAFSNYSPFGRSGRFVYGRLSYDF